jgi:hypothetical protein
MYKDILTNIDSNLKDSTIDTMIKVYKGIKSYSRTLLGLLDEVLDIIYTISSTFFHPIFKIACIIALCLAPFISFLTWAITLSHEDRHNQKRLEKQEKKS